jgi:hypothetical protein
MARAFTAASTQYLSCASAPVTTYPLTLAAWVRPVALSGARAILGVGVNGGTHRILMQHNFGGGLHLQITAIDAEGAAGGTLASGLTAGSWAHVAGVFESNSNTTWTPYINGSSSGLVRSDGNITRNPSGLNFLGVGARFATTVGLPYDGDIAECGIWNAALTAAEIASLAKGMTCDKVRPQSLVFYAPLVRDLIDYKGGLTITNNNTATVANHPRVYA